MKDFEYGKDHARAVLTWAKKNKESWEIICTPSDERLTPERMKRIIEQLWGNSLYDIIFIMLTVHRNAPFVSELLSNLINYMSVALWDGDSDGIIKRIVNCL